jgi:hypothetical protein
VCVIGACGCCSNGEDSVGNAMVGGHWRASWSLVLLAMLWSPSSEDCTSVPPSEGDTSSVKRLVKKQNLAVTLSN